MTTFTDVVEIEAPSDPGLVITRPATADGAGLNLSTVSREGPLSLA